MEHHGGGTSASRKLEFVDHRALQLLVGPRGRHLRRLEREAELRIHLRGNRLTLVGPEESVDLAGRYLTQAYDLALRGRPLDAEDLVRSLRALGEEADARLKDIFDDTVLVSASGRRITPKSLAQKRYVDAFRQSDIVFAVGPAGTGKTYLAMARAVSALLSQEVKRIVLTRPAVEAGEKLGFLPGDLEEKVNPYLRPLFDALHDMMDVDRARVLVERGQLEVAPLAFMRGRTLNASFVILDEAQNTTSEQMLMFLTRLGYDSRAVVTGDVTQVDLPDERVSGLAEATRLLSNIDGISVCRFTDRDVVRHELVQKIIVAYEGRPSRD